MNKSILTAMLIAVMAIPALAADGHIFEVGLMPHTKDVFDTIEKKTITTHRIGKDEDLWFGYNFKNGTQETVELQIVVTAPGSAVDETEEGGYSAEKDNSVFKSKIHQVKPGGSWESSFFFNEKDPTGVWIMEAVVDGKPFKAIEFTVQP